MKYAQRHRTLVPLLFISCMTTTASYAAHGHNNNPAPESNHSTELQHSKHSEQNDATYGDVIEMLTMPTAVLFRGMNGIFGGQFQIVVKNGMKICQTQIR